MRADQLIFLLVIAGAALVLGLYYLRRGGHLQRPVGKLAALLLIFLVGAVVMLLPFLGFYSARG